MIVWIEGTSMFSYFGFTSLQRATGNFLDAWTTPLAWGPSENSDVPWAFLFGRGLIPPGIIKRLVRIWTFEQQPKPWLFAIYIYIHIHIHTHTHIYIQMGLYYPVI